MRPAGPRTALAALTAAACLTGSAGVASADEPAPNCTTADMTGVMAGVSAALSAYLFTRPDVNAFFSGLQSLPKVQVREETEAYLADNPGVRGDLESIRAPSVQFRERCGLPQRALTLADNI